MLRALIVDDQESSLFFLKALLATEGYATESARDGAQALALARQSPPDIVITDLLMPVMDGYTLLRHCKADPNLQHVAFIVCTSTYTDSADEKLAMSLGADAFIRKPIKPADFLARIREVQARIRSVPNKPAANTGDTQEDLLKLHNQTLVRKLQQKMQELEQANQALQLDIQERERAEEALRLLNAVVLQSKESVLITDAELDLPGPTIVFVNPAFTDMTGYTAQEVIGKTPRILQGPDTDMTVVQRLRHELERGDTFEGQAIMYRKSGAPYVQEWRVGPIRNASGHITHYAAIQRDITERLHAMEALRISEQEQAELSRQLKVEQARLLLAQQVAHIGSWETDVATMMHIWSDEMHRIHETDPASFHPTHQRVLEIVHPDDRSRVDAAFHASLAQRARCSSEHRLLMPDGRIKFVEGCWQVNFDEAGKALSAVGTCQDITERTKMNATLVESELRFRQIAENIAAVFFLRTADFSQFLYVNPAYETIWGRSREHLYQNPRLWTDAIVAVDAQPIVQDETLDSGAGNIEFEYQIVRPDGTKRWIRSRGFPIYDANGVLERVAGLADDITEQKEQELKIARLSRVRAVVRGISSAMLRLRDRDDLLQGACRVAVNEGVFSLAWAAVVEQETRTLKVVAAEGRTADAKEFVESYRRSMPEHQRAAERTLRTLQPIIINDFAGEDAYSSNLQPLIDRGLRSGASFPLFTAGRLSAVLVLLAEEPNFFDDDEIALLEWLARDLSYALENIENALQLEHLAYFDALTGLANASLFRDRLNQFALAAHERDGKVCVVVMDLENFTRINETLGRDGGDELLVDVAKRLKGHLVEPYAIGRIGADTFAVCSPGSHDDLTATRLYEHILEALKAPFRMHGEEFGVEVQAGIAIYPDDGQDSDSVFKNAEAALKLAKSSGARHVYYSKSLNDRIELRLALETALRGAVNAGQFILHYQPRVDMVSGEIVGAEALIRWQHPERGMVAPAEFIALAEDSGLILPIGSWAIDAICAQQAAWIAAGIPIVPVAANVSSIQFEKGDIVKTVHEALTRHSLDAAHLHIELTESTVMHDAKAAIQIMQELRKLGVSLALDDFGTGYSSLAYLKRFPFGRVKIDRSFVADITHSPEDAAIASAIIAIAHRMGLKVVAEGVETEGQLNYLCSQGCDEMQGYYFSPPVPLDVFESYLRSGKRMKFQTDVQRDQRTVLVVDDEPGIRSALTRVLRRDGYRVLTAASGLEGLDLLAINSVQVIISDQRMPNMSGTEFLGKVKQLYPETMRIILSGYTDLEVVTDSVNRGAVFRFLTKPWDDEILREQVRDAFRRYRPDAGH